MSNNVEAIDGFVVRYNKFKNEIAKVINERTNNMPLVKYSLVLDVLFFTVFSLLTYIVLTKIKGSHVTFFIL